jgi:hypothetical protein
VRLTLAKILAVTTGVLIVLLAALFALLQTR